MLINEKSSLNAESFLNVFLIITPLSIYSCELIHIHYYLYKKLILIMIFNKGK